MRFRLLACVPVALLLVGLLFASLASFVYATPRDALHEQCGLPRSLLDFAWEMGGHVEGCELVHDGWEAAVRGVARPSSYSF